MKRILSLALILIAVATLAVAEAPEEYEIKEYKWSTSRYYHNDIVIKNTSGYDANIDVTALFKDKDGNIIGVSNDNEEACQDGYETFWSFYKDDPFDSCEFLITVTPDKYYKGVQSSVEQSASVVGKKVIITAKNTSESTVKYLEYYLLYLDGDGNAVDYDWGYLTDSDSELKPGKTEFREESSSSAFASVELYTKGRSK